LIGRARRLSLVGVALGLACAPPGPDARAQAPSPGNVAAPVAAGRLDGEYGLFVTRQADTLRVAWLTRSAGAGWAQLVTADGTAEPPVTTPSGVQHSARFIHAPDDTVVVRYGARDDATDRHETRLRLTLAPPRPPVSHSDVDSIFVVSDIHGEIDTLRAVLRNAGVVDARGAWSAGRAHLVVVGDMVDRGNDATAVLWFLYRLEPQAEAAGGRLDILLGNHEVMVLVNDLRYVQPKELAIARAHGVGYDRMFDPRSSILGTWLVSKPAMIRIDDVLFAHGGVSSDYLDYSLQSFDDSLAVFSQEELFYRWADSTYATPPDTAGVNRRDALFMGERGPLWYRAYVATDSAAAELDEVLDHFDARLHVVGHTPLTTITPTYGGDVLAVNTVPFAAELLLLVREGADYGRWRFRSGGPPERIAAGPPSAPR
jgi:hypothetical protein